MRMFHSLRILVRRFVGENAERWQLDQVAENSADVLSRLVSKLEALGWETRIRSAPDSHDVEVLPKSPLASLLPDAYQVRLFITGDELKVSWSPVWYVEWAFLFWIGGVVIFTVIGMAVAVSMVVSGQNAWGVSSLALPVLGAFAVLLLALPVVGLMRILGISSKAAFHAARSVVREQLGSESL